MVRREGACPSPDACRPACAPSLSLSRPSGNRRTADLTAQMDDREQWYPPLSRSGDAEASSSGRDVLEASVVATRDQVRARFDAATRISGLPPRGPAPRGRRGSRRAGPTPADPPRRKGGAHPRADRDSLSLPHGHQARRHGWFCAEAVTRRDRYGLTRCPLGIEWNRRGVVVVVVGAAAVAVVVVVDTRQAPARSTARLGRRLRRGALPTEVAAAPIANAARGEGSCSAPSRTFGYGLA